MECFSLSMLIQASKQLNCRRFRCCCECKNRYIGLLTVSLDFTGNHVFNICLSLVTRTKRHCNCCHIFTSGRRMRLINDYSKALIFKSLYAIHDIRELLYCRCNDLCITVQCNRKVSRVALIIHNTNQSSLMLHSHDCFLELAVNNNSVSYNDNIIKDNFVLCVMKRSQTVCQPCD